jgi:hypothetical protein
MRSSKKALYGQSDSFSLVAIMIIYKLVRIKVVIEMIKIDRDDEDEETWCCEDRKKRTKVLRENGSRTDLHYTSIMIALTKTSLRDHLTCTNDKSSGSAWEGNVVI